MSREYQGAWTMALIDLVKRSGAQVDERPTVDDVAAAAEHLGISVSDLLDAADVEARFLLATVQN